MRREKYVCNVACEQLPLCKIQSSGEMVASTVRLPETIQDHLSDTVTESVWSTKTHVSACTKFLTVFYKFRLVEIRASV